MQISDVGTSGAYWAPPAAALPPPPPPPPPPAPPRYTEQQATSDAKRLWDATEGGLFGWGTDEDQVWSTLKDKSADELALLSRTFKQNYGKDLDQVLRDELSGDEAKRAESLLQANPSDANAVALHKAIDDRSNDTVLDLVDGLDAKGRQDLAQAYAKRYGGPADPQDAAQYLLKQIQGGDPNEVPRLYLTPEESTRLTNLLAPQGGNTAAGEAQADAAKAKQAMDGWGTDEGTLLDIFRGKTPEQVKAISTAYQVAYGDDLKGRLDDELSGTDQDEISHLLEAPTSDPAAKATWQADDSAIQVQKAVDGMGTDEDALRSALQGKTPEQIKAISTAFEKRYGVDMKSRLEEDLSGDDSAGILHLLQAPAAKGPAAASWQIDHDAIELHRALDGAGTDEDSVRQILGAHTKSEIDAVAAAYRERYGSDLRADLTDDLDGRDEKELVGQLYDRGAIDMKADPATVIAEQNRRTRELQAFEGDTSGVGFAQQLFRADFSFETDGERLERTLDASEAALKQGDIETAARYAGFSEENIKTLVETKNQAGDTAATVAAVTASVVVTVGTAGTAAPLTVAAMSALAAGVSSGTAYTVVNSQAGGTEVARQVLIGTASGATGAVPIGRAASLGTGLVDDAAVATTRSTALGTLRSKAGNEMIIGAQSGAADGAVRTSTESETWKGGFLDGLKQVGTNTVVSGGAGALMGLLSPTPRGALSRSAGAADNADNLAPGMPSRIDEARKHPLTGDSIPRNSDRLVVSQGRLPTCGANSCVMVLDTHGKTVDVGVLIDRIGPEPRGITMHEIQGLLKSEGISASLFKGRTVKDLARYTQDGLPVIVRIRNEENGFSHAVVVDAVTTRHRMEVVAIRDPHGRQYYSPASTFSKYFSGEVVITRRSPS
ncbi:MAG TPA: cysteine peptidase family C39 domain-containing protein [Ideonella sp.]|uniref:cysteine peptidase family C39 domain-containing protein n=1 Tax=Ideonella sp. TaxID=1929293 RepID=UPI002E353963|nr:cysteine peptidase family C39 domain-containing protein [Ideonella sp.]HEX5687633.1 cysteine peptidase family C39 domain-containing protein [Ideonella sp.]